MKKKKKRVLRDLTYTVEEAIEILGNLGSDCDPIFVGSPDLEDPRDMTPRHLDGEILNLPVNRFAIRFYGGKDGYTKLRRGTLHSMILDRMRHR